MTSFALAREAFAFLRANRRLAMTVSLPALIICTFSFMLQFMGAIGLSSVLGLLTLAAMVPALTAWHRLSVAGSPDRGNGGLIGWDGRELRYFLMMMALWLLIFVATLVLSGIFSMIVGAPVVEGAGAPPETEIARFSSHIVALMAIIVVISFVIVASFGLVLPAAATGAALSLGAAYRLAKGRIRSIAGAFMIVFVCSTMLGSIFLMVATLTAWVPGAGLIIGYGVFVLQFAAALVGAEVLSCVYRDLQQPPDDE